MSTFAPAFINTSLATVDPLVCPGLKDAGVNADVLRLDKIHPVVEGNKWFKLKGHLQNALRDHKKTVLTFGGPYSNHVVATAFASNAIGLGSIGLIRGEEPAAWSHTLKTAQGYGMHLQFLSRDEYDRKAEPGFLAALDRQYPQAAIIPEGGAGPAGVSGSGEILALTGKNNYSHLLCAVGTATMLLGLANASLPGQQIIGYSALKGHDRLGPAELSLLRQQEKSSFCTIKPENNFGGYARKTISLLNFMNGFYRQTGIPTDFVYTAKLFFAMLEDIQKGCFPPGSNLLVIHSGGLQGNLSLSPDVLVF